MNKILFVVEGEKVEPVVLKKLLTSLIEYNDLGNVEIDEIILPVGGNIYNLYKKIKPFFPLDDCDVIDIIQDKFEASCKHLKKKYKIDRIKKDYFSEIYLLFDYDRHANDVKSHDEIIEEMFNIFDNETENGKLLISYPMIEAVKDFSEKICDNDKYCNEYISKFGDYKNSVAKDRKERHDKHEHFSKYTKDTWDTIISNYIAKSRCLFDVDYKDYNYEYYLRNITPENIFDKQCKKYVNVNESAMILSAIPEFIIYYLGENTFYKYLEKVYGKKCPKKH